MTLEDALKRTLDWRKTSDVDFPWETVVDGVLWRIRLGDFPAEPAYTLVIDGYDAGTFDRWPKETWTRPSAQSRGGR